MPKPLNGLGKVLTTLLADRPEAWLAREAGIEKSTLNRIIHGLRDVEFDELVRLCVALNAPPAALVKAAILEGKFKHKDALLEEQPGDDSAKALADEVVKRLSVKLDAIAVDTSHKVKELFETGFAYQLPAAPNPISEVSNLIDIPDAVAILSKLNSTDEIMRCVILALLFEDASIARDLSPGIRGLVESLSKAR